MFHMKFYEKRGKLELQTVAVIKKYVENDLLY